MIYIGTVCATFPYWVLEIYANWAFFNDLPGRHIFHYSRPYEALFRDPPWIFTTISLFWNIRRRYDFAVIELIRVSPRFGVLLGAMCLSIVFIIVDIISVTGALASSSPQGINPYWKLAFIFKCLTDTIILDDFKTALDRLSAYRRQRIGSDVVGNDLRRQTQDFGPIWSRRKEDAPQRDSAHSDPGLGVRELDKALLAQKQIENLDLEMAYWTGDGRERGGPGSEPGESSRSGS